MDFSAYSLKTHFFSLCIVLIVFAIASLTENAFYVEKGGTTSKEVERSNVTGKAAKVTEPHNKHHLPKRFLGTYECKETTEK